MLGLFPSLCKYLDFLHPQYILEGTHFLKDSFVEPCG